MQSMKDLWRFVKLELYYFWRSTAISCLTQTADCKYLSLTVQPRIDLIAQLINFGFSKKFA